ncbi:MAG: macro domain-containing protein, partial [Gemmatimonadetes bacterium]|nr:macro domain-containing protein [Gemmatimonadota bacterium]
PQITLGNTVVRLVKGDITELEVDAFVFYAQHDLALGSGFGGMIGLRGGASIQKELDEMAPVGHLEAVVSGAGKLKAEYIIHAVGPRFREDNIETKLSTTMENCLLRAEEKGLNTLAFPAMGAGYYGIPAAVSATVMRAALEAHLSEESGLEEVIVCVLDTPQFNAFEAAFKAASHGAFPAQS